MLENKKAQAQKSAGNIIKALEEGIITEQTKTRLKELEMQINQYDFEIDKESKKHINISRVNKSRTTYHRNLMQTQPICNLGNDSQYFHSRNRFL